MSARTVSPPWLRCLLVGLAAVCLAVAGRAEPARPFREIVLGASLFRAAWAYKHDRPWLESQLDLLARHKFDAIRALGVVGDPARPDYWDGREIDWRWDDYDATIAGLTDLAHDKYGIRVQWTIFADAQASIPSEDDRAKLIERFIDMARGRERKILAFEIANEFYQNGFEGEEGLRQLRRFSARLNEETSVPVAISSHAQGLCGVYDARTADFATVHFDRSAEAARWSPVSRPWRIERRQPPLAACSSLPEPVSNNEPTGPGASVASNGDALAIVMAAVNTYLAGIPVYIFHSGPGVRDDPLHPKGLRPRSIEQLPGADATLRGLAAARGYVPPDVITWKSVGGADADYPFGGTEGAQVSLGAIKDRRFIAAVSGFDGERPLVARGQMLARSIDPLTGKTVQERRLSKGDALVVAGPAAIVTGTMIDGTLR
ncbi:MAG TPA: hypothetical protein VK886_23485 [Vicinamibacterales bacterium]|nr:hypothetical protein [Vicinamibacterales bacterium]